MQMKPLLALVATFGVATGCGGRKSESETETAKIPESEAETAKISDTIIRYVDARDPIIKQKTSKLRDTIIMHKASKLHDTIIMYAAATSDSCKKIPRPPECPVEFLNLRIDTIIK